jgi:splicing factor 3B subunit 3
VQEVVVSRGKVLELLRPNDTGKLQTICSTEVFGVVRSLQTVRLTGAQTDQIVIGSDSGRIVILKFSKEKNLFIKVHQETYGKSGCRRITPGQYLAVDPKGRACMIAAVEKQKFVYVLNRDASANLTISSPLEAHKSHNIVFSIAALDVGFDNPVFAAIELDYSDADQVRAPFTICVMCCRCLAKSVTSTAWQHTMGFPHQKHCARGIGGCCGTR